MALIGGVTGCPRGEADPKRSTTRVELAKDLLRRGQLDEAQVEASRALQYDSSNSEAENLLGLVDYMQGYRNFRLLEVEDCLTGVDADAIRSELDQQMASADRHFQAAIALQHDYGEGWANRGAVAMQLEDYASAAKHFERALEFPHNLLDIGLTRANLGWAYFELGDLVRAAKELRQANQFNPGMCVAKYRLGRVYFARKEWNKALEQFQAVADDRTCPMQEAHLYLLKTLGALGMTDRLPPVRTSCLQLAARSCIAAQCRSVP